MLDASALASTSAPHHTLANHISKMICIRDSFIKGAFRILIDPVVLLISNAKEAREKKCDLCVSFILAVSWVCSRARSCYAFELMQFYDEN